MRVGYYTESYRPIVNGIVASIDAARLGLAREGIDVTTVAPYYPGYADVERGIVRLASLPLPTQTKYRLCLPYALRAQARDLLDVDLIHVHSPFVTGWMGAVHARRRRIPLVFTYHTRIDEYVHYAPIAGEITRRAMLALTRSFADAADVVVAPSRAIAGRLREIGVSARIEVIPSGIDVARFAGGRRSSAVRALLGAPEHARLALVVARLGREKNIELAIDAVARTRNVYLAVVGSGPSLPQLRERAIQHGIADRVRFTGRLDPGALPDIYASSDVFVFPSATETQGLVLLEALAARLPIVAIDVPVTREVVGGQAVLVAANPAALASALEATCASVPVSSDRSALSRLAVDTFALRMATLYRELVEASKSA